MREPVDHIVRPTLPWRSNGVRITECGYDASKVEAITREQFFQREKDLGRQRAAMVTCMTCAETARRWGKGAWEEDPRLLVGREIEWERGNAYWRTRNDRGQRLKDELLAIASLVESHKEEFDASVKAIEGRREWLDRKADMDRKAKAPRGRSL